MPLFLSENDVCKIATMSLALEAVEMSLRENALGRAVNIPRERTRIQKGALHLLQGTVDCLDTIGFKAYTSTREGNRFLIHLYNATSGRLDAIIEANFLGMLRTGAASGIASRYLSRPEASLVGRFGAGWQAQGQLAALCQVRPIQRAKVFSRDRQRLEDFCREQSQQLGIEVTPAANAEEVVRGSDIVTTVTTSATPLFDSTWLDPGCHINAVGSNALIRTEIDEKTIRRCDPIVVDARDVAAREWKKDVFAGRKSRNWGKSSLAACQVALTRHRSPCLNRTAWPSRIWLWQPMCCNEPNNGDSEPNCPLGTKKPEFLVYSISRGSISRVSATLPGKARRNNGKRVRRWRRGGRLGALSNT